jgi:hypothetical protein
MMPATRMISATMPDFDATEATVQQICDCAAQSLFRFCQLTDFPPEAMHESFMASYVFDRLGSEISMAPELMASTIWGWNNKEPMGSGIKAQQRIDLTLFAPQELPKKEQHPWCFIEFKRRGLVDTDYWKIKTLLPVLECPFGVACGAEAGTGASTHAWLKEATPSGERFVVSKAVEIAEWEHSYVVFAYLFAKDAQ